MRRNDNVFDEIIFLNVKGSELFYATKRLHV